MIYSKNSLSFLLSIIFYYFFGKEFHYSSSALGVKRSSYSFFDLADILLTSDSNIIFLGSAFSKGAGSSFYSSFSSSSLSTIKLSVSPLASLYFSKGITADSTMPFYFLFKATLSNIGSFFCSWIIC